MNITVFCSANDLAEKYLEPAKHMGYLLGKAGHDLVWGGSNYGLMKAIPDGFREAGARLVGISVERYKQSARVDIDEFIVADNLTKRRAMLLAKGDVIVMTVGGIGTLDEVTEILELKKQGAHDKVVLVLNTSGFYDDLKRQLQRIADEGFLPQGNQEGITKRSIDDFILIADTPEELVALIEAGKYVSDAPQNTKGQGS